MGTDRPPTLYAVHQAARVAELLDQGLTHRQIGATLGVSAPRVTQIANRVAELRPYLGHARPLDRLRGHRDQLWALRRDAISLAVVLRAELRELDEEIQSAEIDQVLGLRAHA